MTATTERRDCARQRSGDQAAYQDLPQSAVQDRADPDDRDGRCSSSSAARIWTIVYSFTDFARPAAPNSSSDFVGLDQYVRLFAVAALADLDREPRSSTASCRSSSRSSSASCWPCCMDQKIRFENTFRTIFLYPFALSFIVTGLVWQWMLNPDFGAAERRARPRLDELHLRPARTTAEMVIYALLIAGALAGHRPGHVPDAGGPARHRRGHLEGRRASTASRRGRPISSSSSR